MCLLAQLNFCQALSIRSLATALAYVERMPDKKPTWDEIQRDRDERVELPLDPEKALKGLLEVDPEDEPAKPSAPAKRSQAS